MPVPVLDTCEVVQLFVFRMLRGAIPRIAIFNAGNIESLVRHSSLLFCALRFHHGQQVLLKQRSTNNRHLQPTAI
jgi:hypothetical protein